MHAPPDSRPPTRSAPSGVATTIACSRGPGRGGASAAPVAFASTSSTLPSEHGSEKSHTPRRSRPTVFAPPHTRTRPSASSAAACPRLGVRNAKGTTRPAPRARRPGDRRTDRGLRRARERSSIASVTHGAQMRACSATTRSSRPPAPQKEHARPPPRYGVVLSETSTPACSARCAQSRQMLTRGAVTSARTSLRSRRQNEHCASCAPARKWRPGVANVTARRRRDPARPSCAARRRDPCPPSRAGCPCRSPRRRTAARWKSSVCAFTKSDSGAISRFVVSVPCAPSRTVMRCTRLLTITTCVLAKR